LRYRGLALQARACATAVLREPAALTMPPSTSSGGLYGLPFGQHGSRDELANPFAPLRFDVPCHRLRRGRRRVGNVLAYLSAIQPAAAVRITGFGDQADGLALLQQRVAVGGKKSARKLDGHGQL